MDKERYPKSKVYRLAIDHHICRVIVEDCWDIFSGKCICGVTDEKTCFTDGSVGRGKSRALEVDNLAYIYHSR